MNYLHIISIFSPIISILVFIIFLKRNNAKLKWIFFYVLTIGLLVDISCLYLIKKGLSTLWLINLFTLVECELLFLFFLFLFEKNKLFKKITLVFAIAYFSTWVINNFLVGSIYNYDYLTQTIEFILLLFLCLLYYYQKAKIFGDIFIYNTHEFWLVTALLIYCSGTFFSFFIPINITEKTRDAILFEYISRIGNILKNILIAIAFCMQNKPPSNNLAKANSMYTIKY